ncbi:MAG TPA: glycosyl transferase, partial [Pseudomonadota bacterium]|nr:glycosyl transferase [Pseudomonadota bacterium]
MTYLSLVLFVLATVGVLCLAIQTGFLRRFLAAKVRVPTQPLPPISILKPLSGCDDGLLANLESFAALDHPDYEVLLGVHTIDDPAVSVAQ